MAGKPKIVFIGAGSTVFARALLNDLFIFTELRDSEIALVDIDLDRLRVTEAVANRIIAKTGATATVSASTERSDLLPGADYVINMIQVGGFRPSTVIDFEIPKNYGLQQTIGDTLGIGGIMRALRTIPVMLGIARDIEELCPSAYFLNYTNPMAMLTWAIERATDVRTVGLCHSVQGTAHDIAVAIGVPPSELDYRCAGINHMAFYLTLEHQGRDVYPDLQQVAADRREPGYELVRFEMLRQLGYFVTESSEHFSEYVPWFIKRAQPELIEQFNIPLDEYIARCEDQISDWSVLQEEVLSGNPDAIDAYEAKRANEMNGNWQRRLAKAFPSDPEASAQHWQAVQDRRSDRATGHSGEYGSLIVHSIETGTPRVIYGNQQNRGTIANLPSDCCVEVPCLVDKNGIQPTIVGEIPPHLAALMQTNINVQRLTVEAALTGKKDHVYHAAMLDPHTAAELSLDQIRRMVDDLLAAHGEMIPAFAS
jgi:alpha-galactosidase